MPRACQLVSGVDALLIVHQDQICGVETIVTINLDKDVGNDVQARFEQRSALVKHDQPAEVSPALGFLVQRRQPIGDVHNASAQRAQMLDLLFHVFDASDCQLPVEVILFDLR